MKEITRKAGQGISIIVTLKKNIELLDRLLSSFFSTPDSFPTEFIVIDNGRPGAENIVAKYAAQTFIRLFKNRPNLSLKKAKDLVLQKTRFANVFFVELNNSGLAWSNRVTADGPRDFQKGNIGQFIKHVKGLSQIDQTGHQLIGHEYLPAITPQKRRRVFENLPVNILFVSHSRLESNSGYHVQYYSQRTSMANASCLIAVPTLGDDEHPVYKNLKIQTYKDIEEKGMLFPDGRGPDIVHAWTPREHVRKFCQRLSEKYSFKTIIHLEDNEEYLTEHYLGRPWAELADMTMAELDHIIPHNRFHPIKGWQWLKQADGFTYIIDTLARFNPDGLPSMVLPAPVDERLFYPRPINYELRKELEIPKGHVVLAYIGNIRPLKKQEGLAIYKAVAMLNEQKIPTTLIRTGKNYVSLGEDESPYQKYEKSLGWVDREKVPEILAAADILVQPGWPGPFDDQRVPAKLPEYFAMGRPVILPKTNLGLMVEHGKDAWVVEKADAEGIARALKQIKNNEILRERLSNGAVDFYLNYSDQCNFSEIGDIYQKDRAQYEWRKLEDP